MRKVDKVLVGFLVVFLAAQSQVFAGASRVGFYETQVQGTPVAMYVPQGLEEGKLYPLVVAFAHSGSDVLRWRVVAEREKLIVVALQPDSEGPGRWNWRMRRSIEILQNIASEHPIDRNRIWATGYEAGGSFALNITIRHPEFFTAAGVIDAKLVEPFPFAQQKKIEPHRPMWLLNFSRSKYVLEDDFSETRDLLKKHHYKVTYDTIIGHAYSPSQKNIKKMFRWLDSHTSTN